MIDNAAMQRAVELLRDAGIDAPEREARQLCGVAFPQRYADYDDTQNGKMAARFEALVARRADHEPMSHITGRRAFWNHVFNVTADVLDPRPDTETLVEAALEVPFETVLDLGTGSGCIVLSLLAERPTARGIGVDLSAAALAVARGNAGRLELEHRVSFHQSNWFEQVRGRYDLIVCNPPYIDAETYETLGRAVKTYEPRMALTPGGDGLDAYRIIARGASQYLVPKGWLMLEIGFDQGRAVPRLLQQAHWTNIGVLSDLNGHMRVVTAQTSA